MVVCNSVQLQQAQQQQVCWQLSECVQHCASVSASVPYQVHLPAEQVCTTQCKCTYVQLWQVCSPGAIVASVLTSVLTRCNCQQVCSAVSKCVQLSKCVFSVTVPSCIPSCTTQYKYNTIQTYIQALHAEPGTTCFNTLDRVISRLYFSCLHYSSTRCTP